MSDKDHRVLLAQHIILLPTQNALPPERQVTFRLSLQNISTVCVTGVTTVGRESLGYHTSAFYNFQKPYNFKSFLNCKQTYTALNSSSMIS